MRDRNGIRMQNLGCLTDACGQRRTIRGSVCDYLGVYNGLQLQRFPYYDEAMEEGYTRSVSVSLELNLWSGYVSLSTFVSNTTEKFACGMTIYAIGGIKENVV